jgi:Tfp pilus assembly protein PilV
MTHTLEAKTGKSNERGFSILEALIASMVLLIGISGLMALFVVAAAKNAGQGNQATRCTEYAQDKMEQLLALQYGDASSNVVGSVTSPTGGPGLSGTAGTTVGSVVPASPVTSYVDYVNKNDTTDPDGISGTASGAQYMREWSIQTNAANTVKTITVYVQAQFTADVSQSLAPSTTLVAMKQQN